ncbi:MAG: hypothetical protein KUL86_09015 [Castellaniella sp.]|nr:hypothetical protein [Castellaniella sp.]
MSSSLQPGECSPSLEHYFGIKVLAQAGIKVPALKPMPTAAPAQSSADPNPSATEPGSAVSADQAAGGDPESPDRSPARQDERPEPTGQGSPGGFTAHPAADGFTQPAR